MCVDDLVCVGAEPLFLLDYVATGRLDPEQMEQLVAGVAEGCRQAGCALLGGEMAEHPGVMEPGSFDLAGFAVGVVERGAMLGSERVEVGDVLVGLASPGLRSNGYTLARHVLLQRAAAPPRGPGLRGRTAHARRRAPGTFGRLLSDRACRRQRRRSARGGARHRRRHRAEPCTPRLPSGCDAVVVRSSFETPPIFYEIQRTGEVEDAEMLRVFNLGIGMVIVVSPGSVDQVLEVAKSAGGPPRVIGHVVEGTGRVQLEV